MVRHFLRDDDLTIKEQQLVLNAALTLSKNPLVAAEALKGHGIGLLFEKPSLRTRVSSEMACINLGAHPVQLKSQELQLSRGESAEDSARVLCGYIHLLMGRVFQHKTLEGFAEANTMPIVNGLSELYHPLQSLADLLTIYQEWGHEIKGKKLVYLGDGNNVCHSLMISGAMAGLHIVAACPKGYPPESKILSLASEIATQSGGSVSVMANPRDAARSADVLYTDVWASMGDESEESDRLAPLAPYQLNRELLALANPKAIVLHCLPAHRDEEISAEVLDGPNSRVFRQAHNRLPATAALFLFLLNPKVCEKLAQGSA